MGYLAPVQWLLMGMTDFLAVFDMLYVFGVAPWLYDLLGIMTDLLSATCYVYLLLSSSVSMDSTFGVRGQHRGFPTVNNWNFKGVKVAFFNTAMLKSMKGQGWLMAGMLALQWHAHDSYLTWTLDLTGERPIAKRACNS